MKHSLLAVAVLGCASLLGACGGGSSPPPPAVQFSVTPSVANAVPGVGFTVTVTALDAAGGMVATYAGSVSISSSDAAAALPATAMLAQGSGIFAVTLNTPGSQTVTATDAAASYTGSSAPITVVTVGPASHFQVYAPADATSGGPIQVTVTALDASNHQVAAYAGSVGLTSSDGQALLPAAATLSAGQGVFTATLESVGLQTFTATDATQATITGTSGPVTVSARAPLLVSSGPPPTATVGSNYDRHCHRGGCSYGFPLAASGGVPPYSWSWAAAQGSSLPAGFSIAGNRITGIPPIGSIGTYSVVVTVTDGGLPAAAASVPYTFTIVNPPPPVIQTLPGPQGATQGQPYSYQFVVSGGLAPVTISEVGPLPPGLAPLTTAGLLSGTPTGTGSFLITVHAVDAASQDVPQPFTIGAFQHGFAPTGSMQTTRWMHTATLLAGGKVLIAGSGNRSELYDPASGSFAATASLQLDRRAHTATLLCDLAAPACANPRVLVAGGTSGGTVVGSAELYDPATATFTLTTGSLAAARSGHTATLLQSGKVLVTGGVDAAGTSLATAELYDPATGRFSATTRSMTTARSVHTATLLPDGRVLLAGGVDAASLPLASAELYDPASGTFSAVAAAMTTTRAAHTATLVGGKVLIAGGLDSSGNSLATAELYDPATAGFAATAGPLVTPRNAHTAALLPGGLVLIAGGFYQGGLLPHAELFDAATATFAATGALQLPRANHTMTALGSSGQVLVTGGSTDPSTPAVATAELYR